VHRTGYYVDGTFMSYQQAITEVEAMYPDEQMPESMLNIVSRDRLAWMTDKIAAEIPRYWESLLFGADTYIDKLGTNYGGMAHTARQRGTWETEDGELLVKQVHPNVEPNVSLAFSTLIGEDVWNGDAEVAFQLADDHASADVRLLFRAKDKDHGWYAQYRVGNDLVTLIRPAL
jgi:hypothetical protein